MGQTRVSVSRSYVPVSQVAPQPCSRARPTQVLASGSPGAGMDQKRQARSPLEARNAPSWPRMPSSPPETPAITRSPTINGAEVEP